MLNSTSSKNVVWLSRLLRWGLGVFFIIVGFIYYTAGGWPAILFGAIFFITGFFRPKRCIDGSCEIPDKDISTCQESRFKNYH